MLVALVSDGITLQIVDWEMVICHVVGASITSQKHDVILEKMSRLQFTNGFYIDHQDKHAINMQQFLQR